MTSFPPTQPDLNITPYPPIVNLPPVTDFNVTYIVTNSNVTYIVTDSNVTHIPTACWDSDKTIYPKTQKIWNDSSYFTFGKVIKKGRTRNDRCVGRWLDKSQGIKKRVKEFYCKKGKIRSYRRKCPYGCQDGACLSSPN